MSWKGFLATVAPTALCFAAACLIGLFVVVLRITPVAVLRGVGAVYVGRRLFGTWMAPSVVTQSVGLLKDTALGFVVNYTELLFNGKVLAPCNSLLIQTYVVVAVLYLVVNLA